MASEPVVSIDGSPVIKPNEPVPEVVQCLEEMLAKAKDGHITAVACAYYVTEANSKRAFYHVFGSSMGFDLIGGLEAAKARLLKLME